MKLEGSRGNVVLALLQITITPVLSVTFQSRDDRHPSFEHIKRSSSNLELLVGPVIVVFSYASNAGVEIIGGICNTPPVD